MAESSEIRLRLLVSDFLCEPELISRTLCMEPDETWKSGDKVHERASNLHNENGWLLSAPFGSDTQPLNEKLRLMVALLSPNLDRFAELPDESQIGISCIVYGYDGIPEISFSEEVVKLVSSLNAYIDVDVYDLTSA